MAGSGMQAGGSRDLLTEVAGQFDEMDVLIGFGQLMNEPRRVVAAAVVDEQELELVGQR